MGILESTIVKGLIEKGIPLTIRKIQNDEELENKILKRKIVSGTTIIELDGFYSSNGLILVPSTERDIFTAYSKEDEHMVIPINEFDNLVYLNHFFWSTSKEIKEEWERPDDIWVEEMIRLGFLRFKVPESIVQP